jgi:hypothetical protein
MEDSGFGRERSGVALARRLETVPPSVPIVGTRGGLPLPPSGRRFIFEDLDWAMMASVALFPVPPRSEQQLDAFLGRIERIDRPPLRVVPSGLRLVQGGRP